jgi:hypothetical protein
MGQSQRYGDDRLRMQRPGLELRPLRIIGIGAGASGLLLAYKIQRHFEGVSLRIYEKNSGMTARTPPWS